MFKDSTAETGLYPYDFLSHHFVLLKSFWDYFIISDLFDVAHSLQEF